MKTDFEIPIDVKHDLAYCQRALSNHIIIHQKIATFASMAEIPQATIQKSMQHIEREIIEIGNEQKLLFNRLRFFIDYHMLITKGQISDRERLTNWIKHELKSYAKSFEDQEMRPRNVEPRLSADELYAKYTTGSDKSHSRSSESSPDPNQMEIGNQPMQPEDVDVALNLTYKHLSNGPIKSGESLLKPKAERVSLTKNDAIEAKSHETMASDNSQQEQPALISMSRLKLKQALCKAKNASETKIEPMDLRNQTDSPITCVSLQPKAITILSSSQSSNSSSSDDLEFYKDELEPPSKEKFLRYFGIFTQEYSNHLKSRRSQRKRRNCTSTNRMDFHYGKFELFERQFTKRSKNQFLYSPPATRAKRRIGSNNGTANNLVRTATASSLAREVAISRRKGVRSNASSSSSLSSNVSSQYDKVCVSCFKGNDLLACTICCGVYHLSCHGNLTLDRMSKMSYCPVCYRNHVSKTRKTYGGAK